MQRETSIQKIAGKPPLQIRFCEAFLCMSYLSTPRQLSNGRNRLDGVNRVSSVENGLVDHGGEGFTSSLVSVYNLTSTILGAGILAIPLAFSKCGIVLGFFMLAFVGMLSSMSCNLILSSYLRTGKGSYGDLAQHIFGYKTSSFVKWSIILLNIGAAAGYMVVVKQLLPRSLCQLVGGPFCDETGQNTSERVESFVTAAVVYCIIFPMCCMENISSLRHTSMIAFLFAVFLTFAVIFRAEESKPYCEVKLVGDSILNVFEALPVFCFSFVCHLNVLPVYDQLRQRSPTKMRGVFTHAINGAALLYSLCGIFGYLRFSCSKVPGNILSFTGGFDSDDTIIAVARIAESFTCTLALPLIQYPTRTALHSWLFHEEDDENTIEDPVEESSYVALHSITEEQMHNPLHEWRAERLKILIRALEAFVILTISFALALLIPNISALFGLLGSTLCAWVCFILPGMFYLECTRHLSPRSITDGSEAGAMNKVFKQRLLAYFLIGFGTIGGIIGTVATAISLKDSY